MQGNFRYYDDEYGNQYRYSVQRQSDGKFHAVYMKLIKGYPYYRLIKTVRYTKKKTAMKWCLNKRNKAKEHQIEVLKNRSKRKEEREKAKPKLSKEETTMIKAMKEVTHFQKLVKKCDTKIRSATTRKKTYQKKIKYYSKKVTKILTAQKKKSLRERNG